MSLAVTPGGQAPTNSTCIVFGRSCGSVWVASTCSTSEVPIPKASAPNAPWVEVCESPQTIVIPGWVSPELGPDHVDDALAARAGAVELDAERGAVRPQSVELQPCHLVLDRAVGGRDVVIHRRHRELGPAHGAARQPEALEGLRRGDLVDEVEIDVEKRRPIRLLPHDVRVPHLLEERLRHPFDSTERVRCDRSEPPRSRPRLRRDPRTPSPPTGA